MAIKLVVFSCLLALAQGSVAPADFVAAPLAYAPAPAVARLEEYDPLPQYQFGYDVADSLTGDYKSQQEQRDGDLVQGSYSVLEPDGTRRVVDYAADSVNGFNAVVRHEPSGSAAPVAVVPARLTAAPAEPIVAAHYAYAPQPTAAVSPVYARYAAAGSYIAQYTGAPAAAAPVLARYATAPLPAAAAAAATAPVLGRYVASPAVAARYVTTPVAARYVTTPVATRYATPVAAAFQLPVVAPYAAPAAAAPARLVAGAAPTAARAAPTPFVKSVAATGYRYP